MTEPDPAIARERFVPVQTAVLRGRLLSDARLAGEQRRQYAAFFELVSARFHIKLHRRLERLATVYDPFDPDRDTLPMPVAEQSALAERRDELRRAFEKLLCESNYVEVSQEQLVRCLEMETHGGLSVAADLSEYADLHVFYRGVREEYRPISLWFWPPPFWPWRAPLRKTRVARRVAVLVRSVDDDAVYLKVFKDVAIADLKLILPRVRIRMRWFDRLKIGSTVAGSVGTAALKAFSAAVLSPWVFLVVMGSLILAMLKGIFSFAASKTKYLQTLSSSLYFQNLANNSSALALLAETAEAEEVKDVMLAYFFLDLERDCNYPPALLDRRIERWLYEQFGLVLDFDVSDALRKLREHELLEPGHDGTNAEASLHAISLAAALERLSDHWIDSNPANGCV